MGGDLTITLLKTYLNGRCYLTKYSRLFFELSIAISTAIPVDTIINGEENQTNQIKQESTSKFIKLIIVQDNKLLKKIVSILRTGLVNKKSYQN
ncbi:MAG: hypothetical protein BMS9Abin39_0941 [Ignavibacteria bacterium]|nr:MAG: hypothetical protein BMS9Abin39_0941 [Ignavibacteria bacterium]